MMRVSSTVSSTLPGMAAKPGAIASVIAGANQMPTRQTPPTIDGERVHDEVREPPRRRPRPRASSRCVKDADEGGGERALRRRGRAAGSGCGRR